MDKRLFKFMPRTCLRAQHWVLHSFIHSQNICVLLLVIVHTAGLPGGAPQHGQYAAHPEGAAPSFLDWHPSPAWILHLDGGRHAQRLLCRVHLDPDICRGLGGLGKASGHYRGMSFSLVPLPLNLVRRFCCRCRFAILPLLHSVVAIVVAAVAVAVAVAVGCCKTIG